MLEINNLHVKLQEEDKVILRGVDLKIAAGEVHAIMGPNGSGKSTLSYVLSGRDGYEVTEGSALLEGRELLEMEPEDRAAAGLFLAFQYPVEIPGVGNMTFLRTAVNAQRKARGEEELSAGDFLKLVREKARTLKIDAEMLKRPVNVGFSGGEKKRNEILQMAMLEPRMCILDETDSGLDVDAMKLVADGTLSGTLAKQVLEIMLETDRSAAEIVEERGLRQTSDTGEIDARLDEVLAANADKVAEYKSGKQQLFGFFVGQVMKAMGGKANPRIVNERLRAKLES